MNHLRWLSRKFPGRSRGVEAQSYLAGAYRRVFLAKTTASDEDKEIVLADLANASGFYRVNGPGFSSEDRAFGDGMRATFGHIKRFLLLTDDEIRVLEEAARQEAIADAELGD